MQEASLSGLFKTLLYILFFYYLFKFIFRLLFPVMMNHTFTKMEERFRQQQNQSAPQGKTGETVIDKKPSKQQGPIQEGEYIDYEEIE